MPEINEHSSLESSKDVDSMAHISAGLLTQKNLRALSMRCDANNDVLNLPCLILDDSKHPLDAKATIKDNLLLKDFNPAELKDLSTTISLLESGALTRQKSLTSDTLNMKPDDRTKEVAQKPSASEAELEYLKSYVPPKDGIVPWAEVRKQAIMVFHLEGLPASGENVNRMMMMMRNESGSSNAQGIEGSNIHAINNWDSNAKAGHPSKGPCQTIDSTFNHYREHRLPNDIYNLSASMASAINYCKDTYGFKNKQTGELNIPTGGY
ncbi:hypothetical protein BH10CYA1_BH10CYA1_64420 [soil metagenome]